MTERIIFKKNGEQYLYVEDIPEIFTLTAKPKLVIWASLRLLLLITSLNSDNVFYIFLPFDDSLKDLEIKTFPIIELSHFPENVQTKVREEFSSQDENIKTQTSFSTGDFKLVILESPEGIK